MGDRNYSVKLKLKDICAIKHALEIQIQVKQNMLIQGYVTKENLVNQLNKDIDHETLLVETFAKAEKDFRQKYSISNPVKQLFERMVE